MQNILITGASGMLAESLVKQLARHWADKGVTPGSLKLIDRTARNDQVVAIDISDYKNLDRLLNDFRPDMIMHLAAETDVDLCEREPRYCYRINTEATQHLAEYTAQNDCTLTYISSAAVFPGTSEVPYIEDDEVGPVNIYGKSKLLGEEAVAKLSPRYFIARAGWMFGGGILDKKFVQKIYRQIIDGVKIIKAVTDKYGSPTYTVDFAGNLIELCETNRYGLYHMGNQGVASRFEIAREMLKILGKLTEIELIPVSSDEFPQTAPRGKYETLENSRLTRLGINHMPVWQAALKRYLNSLLEN